MEDESTPRGLILAGANIHVTDNAGSTPLHLAVQSKLIETVTLLLERCASVSCLSNAQLSPLYYALKLSSIKLINVLLSAGADSIMVGPNGENPLHLLSPCLFQYSPADGPEAKEGIYQTNDETDYLAEYNSLYQRFVDNGCDRTGRDSLGNTLLFPYIKNIKYRNE